MAFAGTANAVRAVHRQIHLLAIGGIQDFLSGMALNKAGNAVLKIKSNIEGHKRLLNVVNVNHLTDIVVIQAHSFTDDLRPAVLLN
ncbi:Uncharacterised protein [Klebsiella pneumoniae]|nr:Uncharacterised protein [Klebsiella pneumoniae]